MASADFPVPAPYPATSFAFYHAPGFHACAPSHGCKWQTCPQHRLIRESWGPNNYLLGSEEKRIAKQIINHHELGQRLPSLQELSENLNIRVGILAGRLGFMKRAGLLTDSSEGATGYAGDVLRFLSKKNDVWFPKLKPVPVMGTEKENHTSWERYYRVSDCSSSSRNNWYLGR